MDTKTPEQLAADYATSQFPDEGPERAVWRMCRDDFLAAYEAAKPKWISVKDRLPEPNVLVVILHEDEMGLNQRKPPVYFGRHNGQYWLEALDHSDVMWDGRCKITHWMPLPEAPKE